MKILIVNAGSSSLKYQLVDMQDESVLAKGLVERIGIPGSKLTQKYPGSDKKYVIEMDMPTHVEACKNMLSALTDAEKAQRINLNAATLEDLTTLPGIGPKTAQAILDMRAQLGSFRYIEELLHVRGIGQKTLLAIYDLIYVD